MLDLIDSMDEKIKQMYASEPLSEEIHKLIFLKKMALYLMEHDLSLTVQDVIQIEDEGTGYSEYRIVNDCESDDRLVWMEYMEGAFRLNSGDFLIKMK